MNTGPSVHAELTRVELGESMVEVVRRRGVNIKYLLLDKDSYGVAVVAHLNRARLAFMIPAVPQAEAARTGRGRC